MSDDDFFAEQFPGTAQRLRELRACDEEFDQICADYQEVFAEMAEGSKTATVSQTRYLADLAESLSDLRNSIEMQLVATAPSAARDSE
ncbi:hypothetical protein [Ruegeria lacuscaerulensis]|uniref:hypothetical protein n=1 Tax=Ruegeria lacuscaerulensis TaxID=55218 RepID=UPI00147D6D98|nr:hypothetical protein [Ruegeria lacuscaerulensis]